MKNPTGNIHMINAEKSKEELIHELMTLYQRIEDSETLAQHYEQAEQHICSLYRTYTRKLKDLLNA